MSNQNHADCIVASCATSVQVSLVTKCMTQSLATSSAVDSMIQTRVTGCHDGSTMRGLADDDMYNCGSPFTSDAPTFASKHFCIACDKSFTNSEALKKHQTEFCERKLDWFCPICPDQIFGLLDRLNRHHCRAHAETCPHGCGKGKSYPSSYCKAALAECCGTAPEKKAWGCPCCISCFNTLEMWNQHKAIHGTQNEKVENWSFSTMVRSLLYQDDLDAVLPRFPWGRCNWSGLGKDDCQRLKLALERHVLPADVRGHPDYSRLDFPEALARYTFRLGITGKACTELVNTTRSREAAIDLPHSGYGTPEQTFPACQPANLTSQPQDWFDTGPTYLHAESTQTLPSSRIPHEIPDNDELMTWDSFLEHYSPAEDPVSPTPTIGYGPILEDPQDPALHSAYMPEHSESFPGHQQTTGHFSRPGFRHRFRRVIEEGLHSRPIL